MEAERVGGRADGCRRASTLPLDVLFAVVNSSSFQVTELCRLCRICKGWRDIIFESQDLWGHIAFKPCERHVTGEILARLLSEPRTNSLRTLDVSNCIHLLPEHLEAVIQSCGQKIETLVLSNCPAVNDTVLSAVAATCRELKFLALNHLENISDKGVQRVVQRISSLKMLEAEESSLSEETLRLIDLGHFKVLVLENSVAP